MRFAIWNIGTLTRRARELADVLCRYRGRVAVAFLPDTRWNGSRFRFIGNGYQLIYMGGTGRENTVAVVLSEELQGVVFGGLRCSDHLMVLGTLIEGLVIHLKGASGQN